jgi:sulfite exporter TauE/SafE
VRRHRRRARCCGLAVCYNLGRIGCYAALGSLAGAAVALFGDTLHGSVPQLGLWLRGIAGALVVAMGLYVGGWWLGLHHLESIGDALWRRVRPLTSSLLPPRNAGAALLLGGAWGLLPCGLVYSSLTWAATAADPLRSAALMAAFGAGTLPALLLTTIGGQGLRRHLQQPWLRRCAGALLITLGIATAVLPWLHSLTLLHSGSAHHHHAGT